MHLKTCFVTPDIMSQRWCISHLCLSYDWDVNKTLQNSNISPVNGVKIRHVVFHTFPCSKWSFLPARGLSQRTRGPSPPPRGPNQPSTSRSPEVPASTVHKSISSLLILLLLLLLLLRRFLLLLLLPLLLLLLLLFILPLLLLLLLLLLHPLQ